MKLRIAKKILKNSQKEDTKLKYHKAQIEKAQRRVNRAERLLAKQNAQKANA
ncbi:MAG: hypothetical protein NZ551_02005 [Microscillaceae bacterium]|nr:hypothetical protein [Microscillaceae bacterium]MDW8459960.1 hypothetical protein [Cytophagales bacterium]